VKYRMAGWLLPRAPRRRRGLWTVRLSKKLYMPPELIRLDRRPGAWLHCFNVNGVAPSVEADRLCKYATECGGPVCNFIMHTEAGGRRWATVQFFCDSDAQRFCHNCNGRVVDGRRLEIRPLARTLTETAAAAADDGRGPVDVPAAKTVELVNHFVGFNNWSSQVLDIKQVEPAQTQPPPEQQPPPLAAPPPAPNVPTVPTYRAWARVVVAGVTADGTGESNGEVGCGSTSGTSAHDRAQRIGQAKKAAVTNAMKAALTTLVIIRLPTGKVVVRSLGSSAPAGAAAASAPAASAPAAPATAAVAAGPAAVPPHALTVPTLPAPAAQEQAAACPRPCALLVD
jgi:hypothetical protein